MKIRLQSPPETKSLQGPKQIHRERLQAVCPCGVDQPSSNILKKSEIPLSEKLTNWKQIGKRNKNKKSEMTETVDQPHSSISFSSMVSTTVVEQRYQSKGDGGGVGGGDCIVLLCSVHTETQFSSLFTPGPSTMRNPFSNTPSSS